MSDSRLRQLEREAFQGASGAATRLVRERLRSGLGLEELGAEWVRTQGRVLRLKIAAFRRFRRLHLRGYLQEFGLLDALDDVVAGALAEARRLARTEWTGREGALRALGVLGSRLLVREALGLKRMPDGTRDEEMRIARRRFERFREERMGQALEGRARLAYKLGLMRGEHSWAPAPADTEQAHGRLRRGAPSA